MDAQYSTDQIHPHQCQIQDSRTHREPPAENCSNSRGRKSRKYIHSDLYTSATEGIRARIQGKIPKQLSLYLLARLRGRVRASGAAIWIKPRRGIAHTHTHPYLLCGPRINRKSLSLPGRSHLEAIPRVCIYIYTETLRGASKRVGIFVASVARTTDEGDKAAPARQFI